MMMRPSRHFFSTHSSPWLKVTQCPTSAAGTALTSNSSSPITSRSERQGTEHLVTPSSRGWKRSRSPFSTSRNGSRAALLWDSTARGSNHGGGRSCWAATSSSLTMAQVASSSEERAWKRRGRTSFVVQEPDAEEKTSAIRCAPGAVGEEGEESAR
ncbi:hypothetical protein GQ55_5G049800 [Panicum hallii var. hallii]|uniref:Uncharacterized protein n=1 Tax=Panicum hallii var. hallii TaxID=1504633 RepID=A0A2T7DCT0_9POAL|nr:hypothetical protein GQ55_5G049800 [Panicum hallii var. hallii]